jgi:probable HAF family extracellular repeat protein
LTPTAFNDVGDVVGTLAGSNTIMFLYAGGVMYDLGVLSGQPAVGNPVAINNKGQVVLNTNAGVYLLTPQSPPPSPQWLITKNHNGNFTPGQNGATYQIGLTNSGTGPTNGAATVTENVPNGLTLVSMTGANWTCTANTCSRSDSLNPSAAYPPITVTVSVSASAPASLTNQATVSGGSALSATASDPTTITTFQLATMTSPMPASTLSGTSATFSWTPASGADNYWLDVGNTVGQGDISAGATTATSRAVAGLPCDGRTLYVQLWTHLNGAWQTPQRYTYTAANCGTGVAQMLGPTPGSTLAGTTVTFTWTTAAGADNYWLDVGNSVGHGDISAGATNATTKTVGGLPCDGRTLYVQLWTHLNSTWQTPMRYTYVATASNCLVSGIVSPSPGSILVSPSTTFTWSAVSGADQYWLDVGSSLAQGDYFAAAIIGTGVTISTAPCDGRTVYVQVWTHQNGSWQTPQRYTYTAPSGCAALLSPSGSVLIGPNVTFSWAAVIGADRYWLVVGTTLGVGDIFAGVTSGTSLNVSGLPCTGGPVAVELWTHTGGAWANPGHYIFAPSCLAP